MENLIKYQSKDGTVVSQVTSHKDMWVVDHGNGKFHTINCSVEQMKKLHPKK